MNALSGVVTFLFTDIEGSTRRWDADVDAMRAALQAHDRIIRESVARHGGSLFKHTGDGVCAVFTSPSAAVDAAVDAQRGLELPVRMGIATGEAELRDGDYFGPVLNRAARVMACGHGGQILLDAATATMITGTEMRDLGPRRLRDLAQPVAMFQVLASGLRTDFPALKTLDSAPGNLRPPTSSFVGREQEIAEVQAAMNAHRLVTLTGVGGVGKTRLALEVAGRVANTFPDGVWVIELATVGEPAAVPDAVAAVLGITQQPGLTMSNTVAAALEGRARMLVLDNCEHVLDSAADLVSTILQRSETVRILATSREGLRLPDEQLWPVPSLDTHNGTDSTAATLFVQRAQAVAPNFALTDSDDDAVIEICRRLDGIPLAIELAASRMQSMTVSEVHDRLDDRFRLLTGSRRGLERHQTLHHAVQWSYDLLDDTEKFLLTRCSVFTGGFDLAAACALVESDDELAVLDLLGALVRKSLLVAGRSSDRTRYSMLETIRQFAEEQLANSGDAHRARDLHAGYFAGLEHEMLAVWDSAQQRESYVWLALELPNLRAAFRWSVDRDDLDISATIGSYTALLGLCSEQYEPITWTEELIAPARAADHRRLVQLCVMASQCYVLGRVDGGVDCIEIADAALSRDHYDAVPFDLEAIRGTAYHLTGEPEKAAAIARGAMARNPGEHVVPRALLAIALTSAGQPDEAMAVADGLPAAADATHNPHLKAVLLNSYAWAYRDADPAAAYEMSRRAVKIAHDSGNRFIESTLAIGLSRLAVIHGDPVEAIDYLAVAIAHYHDSGSFQMIAGPLAMAAILLDRIGRYESAATLMGFGDIPTSHLVFPEVGSAITHLREVLAEHTYDEFASTGAEMTVAAIVSYTFDEFARARAELADAQPN